MVFSYNLESYIRSLGGVVFTSPNLLNKLGRTKVPYTTKNLFAMSVGCSNFPVKVPKGFNYDAVEQALERHEPVSLADEGCYVALQLCIQDYRRMFVANFIDGEDGCFTIDYEYQTFPFYYVLHPSTPVDWERDSVETMIDKSTFWDRL
ncbi:MAG: hypothetical protein AAFR77_06460 [Cyanobacteria bacterium J06631_2]